MENVLTTEEQPNNDFFRGIVAKLDEYRKQRRLFDIKVMVESRDFPAHRGVLAANSGFFEGLFSTSMKEKTEESVRITQLKSSVFEKLLNYMYTGKIELTEETAQEIMTSADFLLINKLKEDAAFVLERVVDKSNCVNMYTIADSYNCDTLRIVARRLLLKNFEFLTATDSFFKLNSSQMKDILSSSDLVVSDEEKVYEALMQWVKFDIENRTNSFPELFSEIRLLSLPFEYLMSGVIAGDDFAKMVNAGHKNLIDILLGKVSQSEPMRRSNVESHVDAVLVVGNSLCYYVPFEDKWYKLDKHPMGTPRRTPIAVASQSGKDIYFLDGFSDLYHYNPLSSQWNIVEPPVVRNSNFGLASIGDCLYVVGGTDISEVFDTVQRYNPDEREWEVVTTMSVDRSSATVVADDKYLYVIGGYNINGALGSVERYDPVAEEWVLLDPLKTPRFDTCGAVRGSKIVVGGGVDEWSNILSGNFECYDMKTNTWSSVIAEKDEEAEALPFVGMALVEDTLHFLHLINNYGKTEYCFRYLDQELQRWQFSSCGKNLTATASSCVCGPLAVTRDYLKLYCTVQE